VELINSISGSVWRRGFLHYFWEFTGEVALVCEATFVANFGKALCGLDYFMAGLLDAEVTDVFLRCHVEACFELSKKW